MNGAPPPGAVVLAVPGLRGAAEQAAVLAAIAACDPVARCWTDWPRGLVAIASAVPAPTLLAGVRAAGFAATLVPGPARRPGVVGVIGRMLLYAVLVGVAGVVLGAGLGMANALFNPDCTRPGSSGGCAIGVGLFGMLLGLAGIPVGAIAGLAHGLARRRG